MINSELSKLEGKSRGDNSQAESRVRASSPARCDSSSLFGHSAPCYEVWKSDQGITQACGLEDHSSPKVKS